MRDVLNNVISARLAQSKIKKLVVLRAHKIRERPHDKRIVLRTYRQALLVGIFWVRIAASEKIGLLDDLSGIA